MTGEGAWRVVPYHPSRRPAVLELMAEVQGHRTREDEFVWWFEKNPTGYLNIFLAEAEGALIGISCTNSFRVLVQGVEHLVPFSLNVLTHPTYRGRGIFSALELANEDDARRRGCAFMLSFPNRLSTPIFLRRLGWSATPGPWYLVKARDPIRLLAAWGGRAWPERLAAAGRSALGWTFRRRWPSSVEPIDEFGAPFDALWQERARGGQWTLVKDARYLNWRFVEAPSGRYRCFRVREGSEDVGYVVLGRIEKRGIRLGYLADAFVSDRARRRRGDALAALDAAFRDEDVDAVLALSPPQPGRAWTHLRSFFLPAGKRLSFIHKVFDDRMASLPWKDAKVWGFELGDLDFF